MECIGYLRTYLTLMIIYILIFVRNRGHNRQSNVLQLSRINKIQDRDVESYSQISEWNTIPIDALAMSITLAMSVRSSSRTCRAMGKLNNGAGFPDERLQTLTVVYSKKSTVEL